jgi:small redox-active disulfide protein 2
MSTGGIMLYIQVVGSGCHNCQKLESLCKEVVTEEKIEAQIEKVTDIKRFQELGILMTPGLVINGKVVSSGRLPTKSIIANWIKEAVM